MPFAGRLTDRVGAGPVVLCGLALIVAGTLPFALARSSTSYPLLALALVVRGLGMGASTMPAMAGAYATLDSEGVARAASALNVLKRLGGSLGVALLSVVLEHDLSGEAGGVTARAAPTAVLAQAFASSFWWVFAFCALAFPPRSSRAGPPCPTRASGRSPGAGSHTGARIPPGRTPDRRRLDSAHAPASARPIRRAVRP